MSNRSGQGDGIGHDVTGLMKVGTKYSITAWVKFAAGNPTAPIWLTMRRTNAGADSFDTIAQFPEVPGDSWQQVTASYTLADAEAAFIYFESAYPDGTKAPFLVDDIVIAGEAGPAIQKDLKNLKDTVSFPVGVAIDSRETAGAYSELVLKHFNQITLENHMKPEAWYGSDKGFRIHPEAKTLMAYAQTQGPPRLRPHPASGTSRFRTGSSSTTTARRSPRATQTRRSCATACTTTSSASPRPSATSTGRSAAAPTRCRFRRRQRGHLGRLE